MMYLASFGLFCVTLFNSGYDLTPADIPVYTECVEQMYSENLEGPH